MLVQEDELAKLKAELADMEAEDEALKLKKMQVCVHVNDLLYIEIHKDYQLFTRCV